MKVTYDRHTDSMVVELRSGVSVAESDERRPGVVFDWDADGNLVSIEILDASRRVSGPDRVDVVLTP